jgi:hypothetical protein
VSIVVVGVEPSALASGGGPPIALGGVTCSLTGTLRFTPALTGGGGGTGPSSVSSSVAGCSTTLAGTVLSGKLKLTFASSPMSCNGPTITGVSLSGEAKWIIAGAGGQPVRMAPSGLTANSEQLLVGNNGDLGIAIAAGKGTVSGSFSGGSPVGWSASLYTPDTAPEFAALCAQRHGIRKVSINGTVTVGGPYGFDGSAAPVSDGTNLWVANTANNTVTEISASGNRIRTLSAPSYQFNEPRKILSAAGHLWVANASYGEPAGSVTEIDPSTGALIQVLSASPYDFADPNDMAYDGTNIWIASAESVVVIQASSGAWVQSITGSGLNAVAGVAFDGSHFWVSGANAQSVDEFTTSGSLVRTLSGGSYGFDWPGPIVFDGTHVWVLNMYITDGYIGGVTEIDPSTGASIRTLSGTADGFNGPADLLFSGNGLWVANAGNESLTELDPTSGSVVRSLSGSPYVFGFKLPPSGFDSLSLAGSHFWASNGGSLVEMNSSGTYLQTFS